MSEIMEQHPKGTRARVLLTSVFGPYAQDDAFGSRADDEQAPIRHPEIVSGLRTRILGVRLPERKGGTAATIIPSVGCPMACNFCTTSAFFGGKGKFVNFFEPGDELFDIMCRMEAVMKVETFFVMDENFLLHRERALQLLDGMKKAGKSWGRAVFASANAIRKYTITELVELGIFWLWMGLESPHSSYGKLAGTDTRQLTRELREHGIRVQGSTIIGLEHHTRENISEEIDFAVGHATDFHQFMLYTPVPGTPLHREMAEQWRLLDMTWQTFTVSTSSTSGTRRSLGRTRSGSWTGHSGGTMSATGRAFTGCAGPCSRAGSDTRTTPTPGYASDLPRGGQAAGRLAPAPETHSGLAELALGLDRRLACPD